MPHFYTFFSHLRYGKQSWSKPKFGRKLLNSWIWDESYLTYLLILLLIGSLPFQGALPSVLQVTSARFSSFRRLQHVGKSPCPFPPNLSCKQIFCGNLSMTNFRGNFSSQASSALLRKFFLLPLVRYTLTFFKECLPLPFESQETTAQLLFNLAAAGRELLSISQTLPGLLDVEIIWAGFLQKLATRTILLGHSRSPSRKPFKAANIANSSCQIWQNVLESHLSSHAVPTEPAHDGSAWCDWELVSLLQCEPFSMANAVISWRFSSSSVQPSCVNDFVELHCFSRSGKHRFIILNLLNDKKLRVVQCGWFGWFGPIAHRKFDKTGSRKERHNGVCNLVCNFFGFVLKIPCALGHCNLFHTSCQDAFQAMPHPGSSCHSVHLGPQDLRFQNQVHKQRRMMRWIFEQFYVGP